MSRSLIARVRSLWQGVRRRDEIEADMAEEFGHHIELRAQELKRTGLTDSEALRRARQEFGSPARYQEEGRASRGLHRVDQIRFSMLDFKLGFRMLARYPGLTLVGCVAIAVAIGLGALYFEGLNKALNPKLPLDDANRIVGIKNWDASRSGAEVRSMHDFVTWRQQAKRIVDLGASSAFQRNLKTTDQITEPVRGAEITASTFALARVAPLMGRPLVEADEKADAPPVVVIGHSLWKTRFNRDPAVLGQTVKLGATNATVVGVMPEGYGFPINQSLWAPLRVNATVYQPRRGPAIQMFGRLAPGVSLEEAQAELSAIGQRMAAAYPETHKDLRPTVKPYGESVMENLRGVISTVLYSINIAFVMLLVVVCTNVATLVFARTATRGWEITVRSALGASRSRIVTQLFIEALVLTGVSAFIGLGLARIAMKFVMATVVSTDSGLPFWLDDGLSLITVLYAGLLTLVGAAVVGVLPALRVTKQPVQESLRREAAAKSGLRFGGFWTSVIVAQVAITVAFLPLAVAGALEANRFQRRFEGVGAEHYLSADINLEDNSVSGDSAQNALVSRQRATLLELDRRLSAEPGVERVTFANRLPGQDQFKYAFEIDTILAKGAPGLTRTTTVNFVGSGFFDAFGTSVVKGRAFTANESDKVVIVNESFVHHVLADRNAIGQRIRYTKVQPMVGGSPDDRPSAPHGEGWFEIVGVVKDIGYVPDSPVEASAVYHALSGSAPVSVQLAMRVRGDPSALAPRLRTIAAEVDPNARLYDVVPLTGIGGNEATINRLLASVGGLVAFIVLLLSATGIHSLMSFTVARRTREIGIRAALGAQPNVIITSIFFRAFLQLALGVLAGSSVAVLAGLREPQELALVGLAIGVMMVLGMVACAVPLRRALRVHPTDALRAEG